MTFAKIDTSQNKVLVYPYETLISDYKNVSFPSELGLMSDEDLLKFSVVNVHLAPKPNLSGAKCVTEGAPQLINGQWVQNWIVNDIPADVVQRQSIESNDQFIERVREAVQQRLDVFAQERGYDGILSACTYATSTVAKFKSEGQRCVDLRDQMWASAYAFMQDVQEGKRPMPTSADEVVSSLPALTWGDA